MSKRYQFVFLVILWLNLAVARASTVSVDFQNTSLTSVIRLLAKAAAMNVVIHPEVKGVATLSLHDANALNALDDLLLAHGLIRSRTQDAWLIARAETQLALTQEAAKWRDAKEAEMPMASRAFSIRYADAAALAKILQSAETNVISKRGGVSVDARTNTIFVRENQRTLLLIARMIHTLDVPVQQILIEARLASVDHDVERDLGLEFLTTATLGGPATQSAGRYSLAIARLADGSWLDVKLAALEKAGHARLISSPSLLTANLQPASIESGDEIPYQEVSESGGTAVVFKKAVLALHVTPQVLPGNRVLLRMQVNQDRPSDKIVQGVPTISTRQMKTSVLAKSGETVVLGGIYEVDQEEGERGLPLLNRLPLLGVLFKESQTRHTKRELLIFVTPKVMA